MDRRKFIRLLGVGSTMLMSANSLNAFGQTVLTDDYTTQLALISNIKKYSQEVLDMSLGSSFYNRWERKSGLLHYVYVSESDKVKVPYSMKDFIYFGTNMRGAYGKAKELQEQGFHTLVYKTAGTSATKLNRPLMSYPLESIAIIVFHEALHVHLRENQRIIPLSIEEAAGDVLANQICFEYQKQNAKLDKKTLKTLIGVSERIYGSINSNLGKLEKNKKKEKIYKKCRFQINKALRKGNNYQRNRFNYSVNNAFFVRNSFYSQYYFLLKKVYFTFKNPKDFIEFVALLPSDTDAALSKIHART